MTDDFDATIAAIKRRLDEINDHLSAHLATIRPLIHEWEDLKKKLGRLQRARAKARKGAAEVTLQ